MVKVKDIINMFDIVVDVYHDDKFVANSIDIDELNGEHWVMDKEVVNIVVGDCDVVLETK